MEDEDIIHGDTFDLDEILPQVGEFGLYQKLILWLVVLPACFPCGFCAFNQLFMSNVPPHWCYIPEFNNYTMEERRTIAIPKNNDSEIEKCLQYSVNWTEVMIEQNITDLDDVEINALWPKEKCKNGWEFDLSDISSSIVIDYELVCDKDIYPTLGLSTLNLGGPIGVYTFGTLNDRIGRKITFFICLTTMLIGSVLTALSPNFWFWLVTRFIAGLTVPAMYQIPFIIALELVGPHYRSFVTVLTCIFYTIGLVLLDGITYCVRDWVYLTLATSLPFTLYYLYWFFLPESPRWLLANGEFEEASNIMNDLARINKKELPDTFKRNLQLKVAYGRTLSEEEQMANKPGWMDLCRTPNMRLKTCLITLNWFANNLVYIGLSYYGPALGNNQYLSFLLSAIVEVPSYLLCWLIMDRWGRRWPLCICMMLSGVCCICTVLVPEGDDTTTLILFLIAKSAISASFLIIYPFAGELYPTQLRGIGIGTSAYVGGLGLIIIPFINYLGTNMLMLPLFIMGIVSIIGGMCGLRLPETLHQSLPQTVDEGEAFGKNFTMEDFCRCIPLKPEVSRPSSFEDFELNQYKSDITEISLDQTRKRKLSMKKLVRQKSLMDTQRGTDGNMTMTYWF